MQELVVQKRLAHKMAKARSQSLGQVDFTRRTENRAQKISPHSQSQIDRSALQITVENVAINTAKQIQKEQQ
jgi:hypothetical protein